MKKQKTTKFNYEAFVKDLYAMTRNLTLQNRGAEEILYNIVHDLHGVVEKERCFLPRCDGQGS